LRLGRRAVHLLDEALRRDRKGEADDARQPIVERAFEIGLLGLYERLGDAAGHEFGAAPAGEIAVENRSWFSNQGFGVPDRMRDRCFRRPKAASVCAI
jgi:hypothetical protein